MIAASNARGRWDVPGLTERIFGLRAFDLDPHYRELSIRDEPEEPRMQLSLNLGDGPLVMQHNGSGYSSF